MKQILILTRMQLGSSLDFLRLRKKKDKRKHVSAFAILFLGFLLFASLSGFYSFALGSSLNLYGELDKLPGILMAATSMITLVTSVYKVKGTIFSFKDYDIVMSLPVPTNAVVASRVLLLYIINIFFTIAIMVPGFIVYGILAKPEVLFYVLSLISLIFIPLIPIIIASIIGVILAFISSRFKYSNAINVILMILFFTGIFFGSFLLQSEQQIAELGKVFEKQMNRMYPLASFYLKGILSFDIASYFLFIIISLIAFFLFCILVSKIFKSLNSGVMAKRQSSNFSMKEQQQKSVLYTLYIKELKRYLGCSIYIMNTAFGIIILLIGSIVLLFVEPKQVTMIKQVPEVLSMIQNMLPFMIAFMVATVSTTASSISLEGKNLWIIKSAPIRINQWFLSKMMVNFTVTIPSIIISGLASSIIFKLDFLHTILSIILPIGYTYLSAVLGLVINLKFPKFDWENETMVVKQSLSAMLGSLCPMLTVGLPVAALFLIKELNYNLLTIGTTIIVILVSALLHWNLNRKGYRILAEL